MMTTAGDCDFSPMKQLIKEDLQQMSTRLTDIISAIEDTSCCFLDELEKIKKNFLGIESRAATFYLNCYLSPYTDKYMDLSICIQSLSKRRHGALIAVERADALEPFIQSGTPIGAPITHTLLESIFYPGSPLHDGAVVIRANEIVSARNILPLTSTNHQDQRTGTRHRAALGLTEQCDAIVIVVSEETGRASFTLKGHLYPVISP
jgi:diadenylate cyclase